MVSQGKKLRPSKLGRRRPTDPILVSLGGTIGETAGKTKIFMGALPRPRPSDAPGVNAPGAEAPAVAIAKTIDVEETALTTAFASAEGGTGPAVAAFDTAIRNVSAIPLPRPRPEGPQPGG